MEYVFQAVKTMIVEYVAQCAHVSKGSQYAQPCTRPRETSFNVTRSRRNNR